MAGPDDKFINLKYLVYLLLNCEFKRCTLWYEEDYLITHAKTNMWKSHMIASKKMDILREQGLAYPYAQKWVILEGKQKINKKNLALLGKPIFTGTLEDLSNKCDLWNKEVCGCHVSGIFRNKLEIIIH
jgi:hypothetical protein